MRKSKIIEKPEPTMQVSRVIAWRCPTCKIWVKEEINNRCQSCKAKATTKTSPKTKMFSDLGDMFGH